MVLLLHLGQDFQDLFTFGALVSLLTLTVLEIVLGIDNIIFISIIASRLHRDEQRKARSLGLTLALVMRIALLFAISFVVGATGALFHVLEGAPFVALGAEYTGNVTVLWSCSTRDLILLAGGVFLLFKSTREIHHKVSGNDEQEETTNLRKGLAGVIVQIMLIDIVFSFDSILTAIGLVTNLLVMIVAVAISMVIMLLFSGIVSDFVNQNPTIKILALSFLLMIGMILVADAFHMHVPKGYVYFSMAFSLLVEMLNIRMHKNRKARNKSGGASNEA